MRLEVKRSGQSTKTKIVLFLFSILAMTWAMGGFSLTNMLLAIFVLGMIFFHEWGHLKAAEYVHVGHKGMYFLPFLGGVALINKIPRQRARECFIALAGPTLGMVFSLVLAILSTVFNLPLLGTAAIICALINLLNLLMPTNPLDGGRIIKSISFSIHPYVGKTVLVLANLLAIYLAMKGIFIMWLVALFGTIDMFEEFKIHRRRPKMQWFDIAYATAWTVIITALLFVSIIISKPMESSIIREAKEIVNEQKVHE